jgi:hypothetical protein
MKTLSGLHSNYVRVMKSFVFFKLLSALRSNCSSVLEFSFRPQHFGHSDQ